MKSLAKGRLLVAFVITVMLISRCTFDKHEVTIDSGGNPDASVSYSRDIVPIMTTYCFGEGNQLCHVPNTNQGSEGDFTTYDGLKAKVDNGRLQLRVFTANGGMPPPYSNGPRVITPDDLQKLKDWVAAGAPNN